MHAAFTVKFEFDTPVILGRRSNLDAILANLLYEENRFAGLDEVDAINHAHENVPLTKTYGVYAGSSALIPRSQTQSLTLIRNFNRHLLEAVHPEQHIKRNEGIRKNGRPFDGIGFSMMNSYQAAELHHDGLGVWYLGHGDIDAVERLLAPMEHLGKKRSIGYGKIKRQPLIMRIDDYPHCGLLARDGMVLRPIPKSAMPTPSGAFAEAFESVCPPYWKSERMLCYVPPRRVWDYDEILDVIGEPT